MYTDREDVKELIDTALTLEGMPRHASTHAAGVLITGKPVIELRAPADATTRSSPPSTPWAPLRRLGLLKMDFLGLRTLTVIRDTLEMMPPAGRGH